MIYTEHTSDKAMPAAVCKYEPAYAKCHDIPTRLALYSQACEKHILALEQEAEQIERETHVLMRQQKLAMQNVVAHTTQHLCDDLQAYMDAGMANGLDPDRMRGLLITVGIFIRQVKDLAGQHDAARDVHHWVRRHLEEQGDES
jgi:hypothetical protein